MTTVAAVIGWPVAHSLSPAIHNAAFAANGLDWRYTALAVPAGEAGAVLDAMRAGTYGGLSVTMPHKDDVAAAVDERADDVELLGAANCVVALPGGRLRAENTDGPGFVRSLGDAGFSPSGRNCVVLGAGGAARAVVLALVRAGAADIAIVNRTRAKAEAAALLGGRVGDEGDLAPADLVVNATSIGMTTSSGMTSDELPFDPAHLRAGQVVADLVYHPLRTNLLDAAVAAGCTAIDGLGMLVHQAAIAFEAWTGTVAPAAVMRTAARAELRKRLEPAPRSTFD